MHEKKTISERALIVGTLPFGDSDLILRALVAHEGKLSILAKFARKSSKRFGAPMDVFDCGRIEAEKGRGSLYTLKTFIPESSFKSLRTSLEKMTAASILCESFDLLLPEHAPDQGGMFTLLQHALQQIDSSDSLTVALATTFDVLVMVLSETGFADPAEFLPRSTRNFEKILKRIEEVSERQLKSAVSAPLLLQTLKAS